MPSPDDPTTTLTTNLRRLGLLRTAEDLNDLLARATQRRWSPTVLLEHIVTTELEERQRRSIERRLKAARLGRFKPIADWDWDWPTALDRPALERILALDFLTRADNVVLVGAQGLGKTMLAKNLVHEAILAGHAGLFITASDLLLDLNGQETARALERRLRHYARPIFSPSTRSATSPMTPMLPTSSSRSSVGGMSIGLCSSPRISRSSSGTPSFPTPRAPSLLSTGSPTTPTSSRLKETATGNARLSSARNNGRRNGSPGNQPRHRFRFTHFHVSGNIRV